LKYYHIEIKVKSDKTPSYFMGSTLRGAFGYALKRIICTNPSFRCDSCFAKDDCLFYDFYEPNNSFPTNTVLEDRTWGVNQFDFGTLTIWRGALVTGFRSIIFRWLLGEGCSRGRLGLGWSIRIILVDGGLHFILNWRGRILTGV